jgi:hypothetical protein
MVTAFFGFAVATTTPPLQTEVARAQALSGVSQVVALCLSPVVSALSFPAE